MATMKSRQDAESRSVAEQAADWLLILEDATPEEREAFADWLSRSPLHVGAFLRASAVDHLAVDLDPDHELESPTGPWDRADLGTRTTTTEAASRPGSPWLRRGRVWAMAATVAVVAAGLVLTLSWPRLFAAEGKHFSAAIGEQRVLELEDGSVMYLEPGSSVDVQFSPAERTLTLVNGGAMFKVAHDTARPFRVHSGDAIVQAVGTQFSVTRLRSDSIVSVVEGVVQVTKQASLVEKLIPARSASVRPVRLAAGQETRVAEDAGIATPKVAVADPVRSWQEKRLTFLNETLFVIADEFNRYNRTPKIRVADSAAGELRFAAAFDASDMDSLVLVLEGNPKLQVERQGTEIVIRSR